MSSTTVSKAGFNTQVKSLLRAKKLTPEQRRRKVQALLLTTLMGLGYGEGVQLVLENMDTKIES